MVVVAAGGGGCCARCACCLFLKPAKDTIFLKGKNPDQKKLYLVGSIFYAVLGFINHIGQH